MDKQYYTLEDIQDHLKDVRQEYKDIYRMYIESESYNKSQELYIDLLELRSYYQRIKLKLKEDNLSFYYLN